jgi:capsular polysaccharide transport system permease protein
MTGSGLGLILGVAAAHFKEVEKIMMVVQRPLLFISAVLHPISALPESTQNLMLYNPLVHTIELARNSLFPFYSSGGANLVYPSVFAIVVLAIGLTLFHGNRNFLSNV